MITRLPSMFLIGVIIATASPGFGEEPSHWRMPVPEEQHQWWKIVPQEAEPDQLVLSKRNELGIFSNFAQTPFHFHGRRYASVEGFWYMLAYPEGPDDPRRQNPSVEWKFTRDEVSRMVGFEAKAAGALAEANMAALGINWVTFEGTRLKYWSHVKGEHYELIRQVLWEKVQQNPRVLRLLLSTGELELIPDNFDSLRDLPAWRYFDIYAEIRAAHRTGGATPESARYRPIGGSPCRSKRESGGRCSRKPPAPARSSSPSGTSWASSPTSRRPHSSCEGRATPASKASGRVSCTPKGRTIRARNLLVSAGPTRGKRSHR